MRWPLGERRVAVIVSVLSCCALLLQLALLLRTGVAQSTVAQALSTYFSYFTILTNLFVAIVSTAGTLGRQHAIAARLYSPQLVGCATTAIILVGLTYHALLRELWAPQGAQWVADILLHSVVPITAVLHWLLYRRRSWLTWWAPGLWCLYPVAYFIYIMTRGALLRSYPYPFLDVTALGYALALRNAAGLLIAFLIVGLAVFAVGRLTGRPASLVSQDLTRTRAQAIRTRL